MTTNLPNATPPFEGRIERLIDDAEARRLRAPTAPERAPNVLLIMLDDVGFGSFSTLGGPVPAPAFQHVADSGLLYNQFHTTALCSPTRASLLTGRNHHRVHMGGITEIANSFPGYDSAIPPEAASIAQVLRMSGYSTSCFGKWHLTPSWEQSPAGPFDRWPTGMGFDRFYGIIGAGLTVAAIQQDPDEAMGLDGALDALRDQPYGTVLLLAVGLGLAAYGLYCGVNARYRHFEGNQ